MMKKSYVLLAAFWLVLPFSGQLLEQCGFTFCPFGLASLAAQSEDPPAEETSLLGSLKELIFGKDDSETDRETIEDKYGPILSLIHGDELMLYDSLREVGVVNWDDYQDIEDIHFEYADTTLAPNIQVFGWHPYWMGTAYQNYNFQLLSHVSWFAYHIDPATGSYNNPDVIEGWRTKELQTFAQEQNPNTKLLITVASHTTAGNREFLRNERGQFKRLADTLLLLLNEGGGHGIDINFELMPSGYEKAMTDFIEYLSGRLKTDSLGYLLTVVLPKVNKPRVYDIERLQEFVDYFLITGYDYHTGGSPRDGPIAPLRSSGPYSIESTVYEYLEDGLDREKLILGLPYYGAVWEGESPQVGVRDSTLRFVKHKTYRAIEAEYCLKGTPSYDLESWSAYFLLPNADTTAYEKVWFDDSTTLARKYDWVLENELAGIGIWALGYDHGDPRLWQLLETKYASDTLITYRDPYLNSRVFNLADTLYEYKTLVTIAAIFLILFVALGLIASLYDWRVREVFFSNKTLRMIYILASFAVLLGLLIFISYVNEKPLISSESILPLLLGLLGGGVLTVLISRWFNRHRKQLP